ncbi:uncharacterized protein LOC143291262 [Babylonia areolata]|uniref:uncharacterized protein LOC143291262 n=1 Tax=Babylonia areolata TaxID=304850 RepID=UPI003FD4A4EC
MTCAMGGRKDDVKRAQKPHKKRPLSAVLEEQPEADDFFPNANNNYNEDEDNDNDSVRNHHNKSPDYSDTAAVEAVTRPSSSSGGDVGETSRTEAASCASLPETPLTRSAADEDEEYGPSNSNNSNSNSSNNNNNSSSFSSSGAPRKNSSPAGRRQALTPTFSPKLGRRGGRSALTSQLAVLSEGADSDDDADDDALSPTSDMTRVRQTADRLHLSTRRPSVMQWKARYVECPQFPLPGSSGNGDVTGQNGDGEGRWTVERTERINTALDWIINELQEMRTQDQQLARQLLTIRSDLHRLKLARSCEEHQDLLDDVQSELEELEEFADVLDLPTVITDSPLKHLGVTRMNFSARRFSIL